MCQPEAIQQTGPGEPGVKQDPPEHVFQMKAESVQDAAADRPHQPERQPVAVAAGVGGYQIGGLQNSDGQQGRREQHQPLPWLALQWSRQPGQSITYPHRSDDPCSRYVPTTAH